MYSTQQAHSAYNVIHDFDLSQASTEFALQVIMHYMH